MILMLLSFLYVQQRQQPAAGAFFYNLFNNFCGNQEYLQFIVTCMMSDQDYLNATRQVLITAHPGYLSINLSSRESISSMPQQDDKTRNIRVKRRSLSVDDIPESMVENRVSFDNSIDHIDASVRYWKNVAERRRISLQVALAENEELHGIYTHLNEEIAKYKHTLVKVNKFVKIIKEELGNGSNNDTGIDVNDFSTQDNDVSAVEDSADDELSAAEDTADGDVSADDDVSAAEDTADDDVSAAENTANGELSAAVDTADDDVSAAEDTSDDDVSAAEDTSDDDVSAAEDTADDDVSAAEDTADDDLSAAEDTENDDVSAAENTGGDNESIIKLNEEGTETSSKE